MNRTRLQPARHSKQCSSERHLARRGITLYEVLLALVIFAGAILALGRSIDVGTRASTQAQLQTQAVMFCQSKLAEVLSGELEMVQISEEQIMDDDKEWTWSLDIEQTDIEGILRLVVSVYHDGNTTGAIVECSLTRLVRDPESLIDETEETEGAT